MGAVYRAGVPKLWVGGLAKMHLDYHKIAYFGVATDRICGKINCSGVATKKVWEPLV